jgi:2-polyprenyl-3-methyl-5-hydroxy-6-metoxy-1,4-benzoquinol methylase
MINKRLIYKDSIDHVYNGFFRLLNLDEDIGKEYLVKCSIDIYSRLKSKITSEGFIQIFRKNWENFFPDLNPITQIKLPLENRTVKFQQNILCPNEYYNLISNKSFYVATDSNYGHGWLVDDTFIQIRTYSSEIYNEQYFDGNLNGIGYGNHEKQDWRIEKARKLAKIVDIKSQNLNGESPIRSVLDVGSGYGQFLSEMNNLGYSTMGNDISEHAARYALSKNGTRTLNCDLLEVPDSYHNKFSLLTMWDYIEHPINPHESLAKAHDLLYEKGLLFIKTPSIRAAELKIFGNYYHSFKVEHLHYFSEFSLKTLLTENGFIIEETENISHLFNGFLNGEVTSNFVNLGLSSDLFIIARKA